MVLGWDKVKATHPVFARDTLYAESTVLFERESSFERTMLIYKRGHSPEEAANS